MTHDITQDELAVIRAAISQSRGTAAVTWGALPAVRVERLNTVAGWPYIRISVDANPERGAVIVKTAIDGNELMPAFRWLFYAAPNNRAAAFDTLEALAEYLGATIATDDVQVVTSEAKAVYALQEGLAKHGLKLVYAGDKRLDVKAQGGGEVLASLEPQPLTGMWWIRLPGSEEVVVGVIAEYAADRLVSLLRGGSP